MDYNLVAQLTITGFMITVLLLASKEDLRYHRISKRYVMLTLILTLFYTLVYQTYGIERTVAFIIAFSMFGGITFISKGQFGFGDSIIISCIALYIGRVQELGYFFIILAIISSAWGTYCILKNRTDKNLKDKIRNSFNTIETIPIDKVIPGMILADDYFMEGLNEKEIAELKKEGYLSLQIKYAYPFIPAILISFLIYLTTLHYPLL